MKTRIVTGLTAAILFIALIFYGSFPFMLVVALACGFVASLEFDKLFFPESGPIHQLRLVGMVFATMVAMRYSMVGGWLAAWISTMVLYVAHVLGPSRSGDFPKAVHDVSLELLGYWYIVGLFGFIIPIAESSPLGRHYLLLLSMMVFGGDSAAYFAGSRWGRHTLAVRVSPKKSIEGAAAAVVASVGMCLLWLVTIARIELGSAAALKLLLFAPIVSALAQFGDLFESVLKRSQSRKDSGTFLPGHGGMLDRVDGLAIAAPAFYFYILYVLERA